MVMEVDFTAIKDKTNDGFASLFCKDSCHTRWQNKKIGAWFLIVNIFINIFLARLTCGNILDFITKFGKGCPSD